MSLRRYRVAELLARAGAMRLAQALVAGSHDLMVLAYHRILPAEDIRTGRTDDGLVSATPQEFGEQLAVLSQYFRIVSLDDVRDALRQRRRMQPNSVLITFDDGFDDLFTHAHPALKAAGLPYAIFVTTDMVDATESFWYERVFVGVRNCPEPILELPTPIGRLDLSGGLERRSAIASEVVQRLKAAGNAARESVVTAIDQLRSDLDCEVMRPLSRPITSGELRSLHGDGVAVGSHTCSHPILSRCDRSRIDRELVESKRALEQWTGSTVYSLAYPNGQAADIDDVVKEASIEAGYEIAFSTVTGGNVVEAQDPMMIKRITMGRGMGLWRFRGRIVSAR